MDKNIDCEDVNSIHSAQRKNLVVSSCGYDNKFLSFIYGYDFLDEPSNYQLFKREDYFGDLWKCNNNKISLK
jgi:hypothetical protein